MKKIDKNKKEFPKVPSKEEIEKTIEENLKAKRKEVVATASIQINVACDCPVYEGPPFCGT